MSSPTSSPAIILKPVVDPKVIAGRIKSATDCLQLLSSEDINQRIAELDGERAMLVVLRDSVKARETGVARETANARSPEDQKRVDQQFYKDKERTK